MNQAQSKRTVVDVDTRRAVAMVARARKPRDVTTVNHETFIRNTLKDRMGWPRREPAPEAIKAVAKEMAAMLVKRDKEVAAKNAAEKAAKEAAEATM